MAYRLANYIECVEVVLKMITIHLNGGYLMAPSVTEEKFQI